MEVRLHDDATGAPRPFALQLQRRAGKLGVLLTAADGGGERYMLSDAVAGLDLSEDDFVGRVRLLRGFARDSKRSARLAGPSRSRFCLASGLTRAARARPQSHDDAVTSFLAQLQASGFIHVRFPLLF